MYAIRSYYVNKDGTIAGRPEGAAPNAMEEFQRIKLVNPDIKTVDIV